MLKPKRWPEMKDGLVLSVTRRTARS